MARIHILAILLLSLLSFVSASAPTFCKCTCFSNSTIIRLGPQPDDPSNNNPPPPPPSKPTTTVAAASSSSSSSSSHDARSPNPNHPISNSLHSGGSKRAASSSCTQCNRAFCLQYNLPICKDAEEKDVTTTCFQRDSRKDKVIVWGFILGTAGLLGWAGVRRVLEKGQVSGFGAGGAGGRATIGGFMGGVGSAGGNGGTRAGGSSGGLGGMGAAGGLFRRVFAGSSQRQGQGSGGGAGAGTGQGTYSPLGGEGR